jgi:nitrite reductase/ring-hydroxylating ferredoxin subunit
MAGHERVICASADLEHGGPGVRFEASREGAKVAAFVVRFRDHVRAYVNECRHQGTELDWTPGDFFDEGKLYLICASHGAAYDPDSGRCVAGPCRGSSLAPVSVAERDGNVVCTED